MDDASSPRNDASDSAYEGFHLVGDREYLEWLRTDPGRWYRPTLVREDRRRFVGAPTTRTLAEFVEQAATRLDLGDTTPIFSLESVVAVRVERCAPIRCRVACGDTATDFRNATTGETQIAELFDLDDTDAAIAELDRLHDASENGTDARS